MNFLTVGNESLRNGSHLVCALCSAVLNRVIVPIMVTNNKKEE